MGLEADLLNLDLADRISYDPTRNILFLNFEGMYVRVKADIVSLRDLLEQRCKEIGKRVGVFVNYDTFRINENVADDLAEMDRYMLQHYWSNITRYATSAFMRMKLDQAFSQRNIAPMFLNARRRHRLPDIRKIVRHHFKTNRECNMANKTNPGNFLKTFSWVRRLSMPPHGLSLRG